MVFGSWRNLYFLIKLLYMNADTLTSSLPIEETERRTTLDKRAGAQKMKFQKIKEKLNRELQERGKTSIGSAMSQLNEGQKRAYSEPSLSHKTTHQYTPSKQLSEYKSSPRFSRQELSILSLDPSLEKLKKQHIAAQNDVQIKYVNTLKKIKATSSKLGCKVKVQSTGFTLQNTHQKEKHRQQTFNYNFGKEFNRYFRRKLVQKLHTCEAANQSLEIAMNNELQQMQDTIRLNKKKLDYRNFTSNRMTAYIKGISHQQKKLPFSTKKELDRAFEIIKEQQEMPPLVSRKVSEVKEETEGEEKSNQIESPSNRGSKTSHSKGSKNSTAQKWAVLLNEYQEDIEQFEQICDFFQRIQHQLLRYMPNNHLDNKINNIIAQAEHSEAIRKIYNQCNTDISELTPQRIVKILKKEEGILSCMNYIVNVIKLNISAQRRKRFQDLEKVLGKYQSITAESIVSIADKLKNIDNPEVKKKIEETVRKTDTSCRGLDPSYISFVRQAEEQEFSSINSGKTRNIICQILKFQSLMK